MVGQVKPQSPAVASFVAMEASVQAVARSLTPAQLAAPSACTGWRVRDVIAHIIGDQARGIQVAIPRALASDLTPPPDVTPAEVSRQAAAANARDQATLARLTDDALLAELDQAVTTSTALVNSLSAAQLALPCWSVFSPRPISVEDVIRAYTAEIWAHERWDIRRALDDRSPAEPTLLQPQAEALVRLMPALIIPEKAASWDAVIGLTLTGPSGGEWAIRIDHGHSATREGRPAKATTRFTMDPETFARVSWKRDHPLKAALRGKSKMSGNPLVGMKFGGLFPTF